VDKDQYNSLLKSIGEPERTWVEIGAATHFLRMKNSAIDLILDWEIIDFSYLINNWWIPYHSPSNRKISSWGNKLENAMRHTQIPDLIEL
jgi:hypothetical protein